MLSLYSSTSRSEPTLEQACLAAVSSIPDQFHAATQFADSHRCPVKRSVAHRGVLEERCYAAIGFALVA
jgi:hypothetical protein